MKNNIKFDGGEEKEGGGGRGLHVMSTYLLLGLLGNLDNMIVKMNQ